MKLFNWFKKPAPQPIIVTKVNVPVSHYEILMAGSNPLIVYADPKGSEQFHDQKYKFTKFSDQYRLQLVDPLNLRFCYENHIKLIAVKVHFVDGSIGERTYEYQLRKSIKNERGETQEVLLSDEHSRHYFKLYYETDYLNRQEESKLVHSQLTQILGKYDDDRRCELLTQYIKLIKQCYIIP